MGVYALGGSRPELPGQGEYWLAPNASLIGKVRLKKGASVWFGAVIRGDNDWITIGENSNVQDGAVLHTDDGIALDVGANVTIGHGAVIHGARIGDNCLIGINATVLNRVVLGASCLVGANALLPEGKTYPEKSLIVGVPARVARPLSEDEIAFLPLSAAHYCANAERFREELKQLG
jgi:carbonic anhydrase/acetyltransferase-like protein (isoleucine patch superfamily)